MIKEEWEKWVATGRFMQWSMDGENWALGINDGAKFFRITEEGKDDIVFKLEIVRKPKLHKTDFIMCGCARIYLECCEGHDLNLAKKHLHVLTLNRGPCAPSLDKP